MFKTFIGLRDNDEKSKLQKICEDIAKRDSSFKFSIRGSRLPQYTYILVVLSETQDQAFKRGGWLISKTGAAGLKYWVKGVEQ
jgi:hypothetical protein